jgi:hypothetical protein
MSTAPESKTVAIAKEYFKRLDARSPTILELFTQDVQFYFPKFGIGRGPSAILEAMTGIGGRVESVEHAYDSFVFIPSGSHLAVEGTTRGQLKNGIGWAAGQTPGGRFCNIFQFRDELICRLHIYLDPDYGGEDAARFLWGRTDRAW